MNNVWKDFVDSLHAWRFWTLFGYHDAHAPMRRTRFGFLFYTLQTLLRTTVIFLVLGPAIGNGHPSYFGYVALGVPIFHFYSTAISSGYSILSRNGSMIESGKVPFIACIFRFFVDNSVRFLFALPVYIGYVAIYPSTISWSILMIFPGILIAIVFILAMAMTFMVIGAFFPDFSEFIYATMGLLFFATPIFWYPGDRGGIRGMLAHVNPFTHLIAIVREPALGNVPEIFTYIYAGSLTAFVALVSVWLFSRTRNWIIYKL